MAYMFYRVHLSIVGIERRLVNLLGLGGISMSLENDDQEARRNAQLIASMATFRGRLSSEEIKSRSAYSRE